MEYENPQQLWKITNFEKLTMSGRTNAPEKKIRATLLNMHHVENLVEWLAVLSCRELKLNRINCTQEIMQCVEEFLKREKVEA